MQEQLNIKFKRKQLKNQKGMTQKIYIDMNFLVEQSGFGWDQNTGMVTADQDTWDELTQVLCYASPFLYALRPSQILLFFRHTQRRSLPPSELIQSANIALRTCFSPALMQMV
jgi:hypothetical protein